MLQTKTMRCSKLLLKDLKFNRLVSHPKMKGSEIIDNDDKQLWELISSHSGRRTFITETSKKISLVGGSLRDIQMMVGHSSLQTTQRYIESDSESQRKVVELI